MRSPDPYRNRGSVCLSGLIFLFCLAASVPDQVQAQDPSFSQFFATELYMNPAFAGTHERPTLSLSFRDQWPGLPSRYLSYGLQYDQPLDLVHGGLGLILLNDQQGGNAIRRTLVGAVYSYHLQLSREAFIHTGIQFSFLQKHVNTGSFVFPDMIDPQWGVLYPTSELVGDYQKSLLDFSAGWVFTHRDLFAGLSVHHLTRPNEAYAASQTVKLPRRYSLQAGMNFYLGEFREDPDILILTPHFLLENQLRFWTLVAGLNLSKNPYQAGLRFRMDPGGGFDSFILMTGFSGTGWIAAYSFDLPVRRYNLPRPLGGAHEISLSVSFWYPEKRKRIRAIKCPRI